MTPDKEASMRAQLSDYSKQEFIDLAISLQDVIDEHVDQKRAMQSSIDAMRAQIPALQSRISELEALDVAPAADPEEIIKLEHEAAKMRAKYEDLRERFDKVQELNEKYQEKLLNAL